MRGREGVDWDYLICEARGARQMQPGSLFDDYQAFTRTTAIYPGHGEGSAEARIYCLMGLCGESGELAEKVKKIVRGGGFDAVTDLDLDQERLAEIKKELGDCVWYAARLADELGLKLSDVAATNVAKLSSRKKRNVLHGEGDNR